LSKYNKITWRKEITNLNFDPPTYLAFSDLSNCMGLPRAKRYVELIFTKAKEQNNEDILTIEKIDGKKKANPVIAALMNRERATILLRRGFYQDYLQRAENGDLAIQLNNNLRALNNYYNNPLPGNPVGRELAIDQAANWICGEYTAGLPGTRALLGEYIPTTQFGWGKFGQLLGRTPAKLWEVHPRLVPGLVSQERLSTRGNPRYPSTVGAGFLFEELFTSIAGKNEPPFGDANWENFATFFLASIGTIQVFPDGNKRMGKFAYSVLLIKGTHTFKAPTEGFCLGLFRMQG
jgi:hypothetical protein